MVLLCFLACFNEPKYWENSKNVFGKVSECSESKKNTFGMVSQQWESKKNALGIVSQHWDYKIEQKDIFSPT